jgi:hypothetical protein
MSADAVPTAAAAPTLIATAPSALVDRLLAVAIAYDQAHAVHNVKEQTNLLALLRDTVHHLAPHLGPVRFAPTDRAETEIADGARLIVNRGEAGLIGLTLVDALGDDACVHLDIAQAQQLRADLTSVLLSPASRGRVMP